GWRRAAREAAKLQLRTRLESRDGVVALRVPEYPALEPVVVSGLFLGANLRGIVVRRPQREILVPRNDPGGVGTRERPCDHILEDSVDRRVRMRVRISILVGA